MNNWASERPNVVNWVMKQIEKKDENPPVLILEPMKLYKLSLLENPQKVEGADEGYVVKVKNGSDNRDYLLFLQRFLASKFREIKATKGDVLAVIVKERDMFTGYNYVVGSWDKSFDERIRKLKSVRERRKNRK